MQQAVIMPHHGTSCHQIPDCLREALADALVANKTVTSINLERNEIGDVGMQAGLILRIFHFVFWPV